MRIAIYGLGYVGLTAAACLAKQGHSILGVDVSEGKVTDLAAGRSSITEPEIPELLAGGAAAGLIDAVQHVGDRLADCDLAMVCVGTPSAPDGSHNMSYIAEVSRQIARAVGARSKALTVVYRSTVRPGTTETLVAPIFQSILGAAWRGSVELVYNPEFLRESVAVKDYFNPPKIVIGTEDGLPSSTMSALYSGLQAPVFVTRYREAELTKFVDNSFHAVKVAFANEVGRVCHHLGISATKVHEIFISDTKLNISPYYLRPGGPFGGSCLPKDVRALQFVSADVGANTHLIDALLRSNDAHKNFIFNYSMSKCPQGGTVLMLGLAFKADSDDLRESPHLDLARKILAGGYKLRIYDPAIKPGQLVGQNLGYAYTHLPAIGELLASSEEIEQGGFDLVIDTAGRGGTMTAAGSQFVDISTLR